MTARNRVIVWAVVTASMLVGFNLALFTGHPGLFFALWIPAHIPAAFLGAAIADYQFEGWER